MPARMISSAFIASSLSKNLDSPRQEKDDLTTGSTVSNKEAISSIVLPSFSGTCSVIITGSLNN